MNEQENYYDEIAQRFFPDNEDRDHFDRNYNNGQAPRDHYDDQAGPDQRFRFFDPLGHDDRYHYDDHPGRDQRFRFHDHWGHNDRYYDDERWGHNQRYPYDDERCLNQT